MYVGILKKDVVLLTGQKALPLFKEGSSIILNASTAGSKASKISSVYGATKAAVRSFARSFTPELINRKIRFNALSPGPIDTPGLSDAFSSLGMTDDQMKKTLISFVPLGRLGTP
jgi:NAD(P)-dependent dehydrogenase (short-subunit alcohol dehydrogenase family)